MEFFSVSGDFTKERLKNSFTLGSKFRELNNYSELGVLPFKENQFFTGKYSSYWYLNICMHACNFMLSFSFIKLNSYFSVVYIVGGQTTCKIVVWDFSDEFVNWSVSLLWIQFWKRLSSGMPFKLLIFNSQFLAL